MNYETATCEDVIAAWDANDLVWTIDLGGMGPGYEQCIQIMLMEMLRAMIASPPEDWSALDDDPAQWREYRDAIDEAIKPIISKLGPSGAQHSAAIYTAARFMRDGYGATIKSVSVDRRIMVSKRFPQVYAEDAA
jgi:hypothetical protein